MISRFLRNGLAWIFASACLILVTFPDVGGAQGFTLTPMSPSVSVLPGRTYEFKFNIKPLFGANPDVTVEFRSLERFELQAEQEQAARSISDLMKTRATGVENWIDHSGRVLLREGKQEYTLRIKAPPDASGEYYGVFMFKNEEQQANAAQIALAYRVPFKLVVLGRPRLNSASLVQLSIEEKSNDAGEPVTEVMATVRNNGNVAVRFRPRVAIERQVGGVWRTVTVVELDEEFLMPQQTLEIDADTLFPLPSGSYRLVGTGRFDGRAVRQLKVERQYVASEAIGLTLTGADILIEPKLIDLKVPPGAFRSAVVTVKNLSMEPVQLNFASLRALISTEDRKPSQLPETLVEKSIQIVPDQATLKPLAQRQFRVMLKRLNDTTPWATFHSELLLSVGQVGENTSYAAHIDLFAADPFADIKKQLTVGRAELSKDGDRYFWTVFVQNTGALYMAPALNLSVRDSDLQIAYRTSLQSGEYILPDDIVPLSFELRKEFFEKPQRLSIEISGAEQDLVVINGTRVLNVQPDGTFVLKEE